METSGLYKFTAETKEKKNQLNSAWSLERNWDSDTVQASQELRIALLL